MRAIRLASGATQAPIAGRAGVSQSLYSRVERGLGWSQKVSTMARIARALDADLVVDLRYRGGRVDRLIDRAHAAIVETVVATLRSAGWETVVEYSFNVFGERGSVDILAWHAATRTLLLVEVKSRLTDLQAMFHSLGRKLRLVPNEASRTRLGPARGGPDRRRARHERDPIDRAAAPSHVRFDLACGGLRSGVGSGRLAGLSPGSGWSRGRPFESGQPDAPAG